MSSSGGGISRYVGKAWATVAVAAAVGAGVALAPGVTGGGDGGATANLWVDTNGGTCTRQATPAAYTDGAACSSLDAARDAATGGDTVRIKDGSYGAQTLTGTNSSTVTFTGETVGGVVLSALTLVSDTVVEDLTVANDTQDSVNDLNPSNTTNVTLRNVRLEGDYIRTMIRAADNFAWVGGRLGDFDGSIQKRTCNPSTDIPMFIGTEFQNPSNPSNGVLIEGLTFGEFQPSEVGEGGCVGDNVHLERIRIDGPSDDIMVRRVTFVPSGDNTGVIFISPQENGKATNVKIVGNLFQGAPNVPILSGTGTCANYIVAYNTIDDALGDWGTCTSTTGMKIVGNVHGHPSSGDPSCAAAAWIEDMNQTGSLHCPDGGDDVGNEWVSGPNYNIENILPAPDFRIPDGSNIVVDAAEVPGASDICTDASIMGTLGDIDGEPRFSGSACDNGADEWNG